MNLIEINESNYQDYLKLDIVAFSFAYEGEMGEPGAIFIVDRDGQFYHTNYCWSDDCIDREHIKDLIPVFVDLDFGLLGCESKNKNWQSIDLGYGKSLLICNDISVVFNKKVDEANFQTSGELFQQWPGIVLGILNKGDSSLTINDFWGIKPTNITTNKLLPYQNGEYYGFIDCEGHTVIPYIYQFARFFNEGLAYVKDDEEKWSFINEEGTMVIPCDKWKGAGDFHEGLAYVVTKNDKWGYIDKSGKNLIPCKWQEADDFSEDYAAVKDETGKYGYINRQGAIVIPCKYFKAKPFNEGLAIVQISEDKWTFIDTEGKSCSKTWAEVQPFSEGLAPVKNSDGLWGYIDEKWQVKLDFKWDYANRFSEGLASVSHGDRYAFINKQGDYVLPYQWVGAGEFHKGLAPVDYGPMKWGYVDVEGNLVVPARWTFASSLENGPAFVCDVINRESGYIDENGRFFNAENPLSISTDDSDVYPFDDFDDKDYLTEMKLYKVGCSWEYIRDPKEIQNKYWEESEEFDRIAYVALPNDRPTPQVCVLQQGSKYGIYTAYHTNGPGGPGTWCNPMVVPFPYDEVKFFTALIDNTNEYGLFAFRIDKKWGIIKVVDGRNKEKGVYDVEYPLTKRRIVVPCEYVALEDAELQLGESYDWEDPFKEEISQTDELTKRDVKKGKGRDKIRVTFPDGTTIEDSVVWKTLAETIKRIGVKRVEQLKIPGNIKRNILLVDTHPTDDIIYQGSQKEIEPGYYLLTYNNTNDKAKWLGQISDELHLNLKIEILTSLK